MPKENKNKEALYNGKLYPLIKKRNYILVKGGTQQKNEEKEKEYGLAKDIVNYNSSQKPSTSQNQNEQTQEQIQEQIQEQNNNNDNNQSSQQQNKEQNKENQQQVQQQNKDLNNNNNKDFGLEYNPPQNEQQNKELIQPPKNSESKKSQLISPPSSPSTQSSKINNKPDTIKKKREDLKRKIEEKMLEDELNTKDPKNTNTNIKIKKIKKQLRDYDILQDAYSLKMAEFNEMYNKIKVIKYYYDAQSSEVSKVHTSYIEFINALIKKINNINSSGKNCEEKLKEITLMNDTDLNELKGVIERQEILLTDAQGKAQSIVSNLLADFEKYVDSFKGYFTDKDKDGKEISPIVNTEILTKEEQQTITPIEGPIDEFNKKITFNENNIITALIQSLKNFSEGVINLFKQKPEQVIQQGGSNSTVENNNQLKEVFEYLGIEIPENVNLTNLEDILKHLESIYPYLSTYPYAENIPTMVTDIIIDDTYKKDVLIPYIYKALYNMIYSEGIDDETVNKIKKAIIENSETKLEQDIDINKSIRDNFNDVMDYISNYINNRTLNKNKENKPFKYISKFSVDTDNIDDIYKILIEIPKKPLPSSIVVTPPPIVEKNVVEEPVVVQQDISNDDEKNLKDYISEPQLKPIVEYRGGDIKKDEEYKILDKSLAFLRNQYKNKYTIQIDETEIDDPRTDIISIQTYFTTQKYKDILDELRKLKESLLGGTKVYVYLNQPDQSSKSPKLFSVDTENEHSLKLSADDSRNINECKNKNKGVSISDKDKTKIVDLTDSCVKAGQKILGTDDNNKAGGFYKIIDNGLEQLFTDIQSQIKPNTHITIFGYGFSGSGKTFIFENLMGVKNKKSLIGEKIKEIKIHQIIELYGMIGLPSMYQNGGFTFKKEDNVIKQLTYNYNREEKKYNNNDIFGQNVTEYAHDNTKENKFNGCLKMKIQYDIPKDNTVEFSTIYDAVQDIRRKELRIKATPNNPESSRGHLFMTFEVTFDNGKGYITFCDMAGSEKPDYVIEDVFGKIAREEMMNNGYINFGVNNKVNINNINNYYDNNYLNGKVFVKDGVRDKIFSCKVDGKIYLLPYPLFPGITDVSSEYKLVYYILLTKYLYDRGHLEKNVNLKNYVDSFENNIINNTIIEYKSEYDKFFKYTNLLPQFSLELDKGKNLFNLEKKAIEASVKAVNDNNEYIRKRDNGLTGIDEAEKTAAQSKRTASGSAVEVQKKAKEIGLVSVSIIFRLQAAFYNVTKFDGITSSNMKQYYENIKHFFKIMDLEKGGKVFTYINNSLDITDKYIQEASKDIEKKDPLWLLSYIDSTHETGKDKESLKTKSIMNVYNYFTNIIYEGVFVNETLNQFKYKLINQHTIDPTNFYKVGEKEDYSPYKIYYKDEIELNDTGYEGRSITSKYEPLQDSSTVGTGLKYIFSDLQKLVCNSTIPKPDCNTPDAIQEAYKKQNKYIMLGVVDAYPSYTMSPEIRASKIVGSLVTLKFAYEITQGLFGNKKSQQGGEKKKTAKEQQYNDFKINLLKAFNDFQKKKYKMKLIKQKRIL